jgi:hypothetical protein
VSDRYQWIRAHVLDTTAALALDADQLDRARAAVTALAGLTARCDLRELLVRAHVHRHRLGDEDAMPIARSWPSTWTTRSSPGRRGDAVTIASRERTARGSSARLGRRCQR